MIAGDHETVYAAIVDAAAGRPRILVGIAGPPGVGKSTLSEQLCRRLNDDGHAAAIVPMDGFHLDNTTLKKHGLLHRKGAPETFDAAGFVALVETLRTAQAPVAIPVFDRQADRVREAAETVDTSCRIVLVEGNYLLLDQAPWTQLPPLFDLSILVAAPPDILRARLIRRWLDTGLDRRKAEERAGGNDIPNATLVLEQSTQADLVLASGTVDEAAGMRSTQ